MQKESQLYVVFKHDDMEDWLMKYTYCYSNFFIG